MLLSLFAIPAWSDANSDQISALINQTSAEVISIALAAKSYEATEPDRYYQQIADKLLPVFDYDYFARAVMGHTASNRYLQTLSPEQQTVARQQIADFKEALRATLIKSYGKTFLNFADSKLELKTVELMGEVQASAIQQVTDTSQQHYTIQYTLRKIKGEWKIQNFIVEGINMGQSYRAQFDTALERYKGSVPDVIQHWPEIMNQNEKQ
jgi:phospholipid transport system substrate-binding protein